jgi:two-component system, OmpR family, response regulator
VVSNVIKLLIVDDEPDLVEWLTAVISHRECEIRVAFDGSEAVSVAKDFRPDCVLTGVMMPRMGGFEEAGQILEFLPDCKFVLMSGSAYLQEVRDAHMKVGFDLRLLLTKPFTVQEMFTALQLAGFPYMPQT